MKNVDAITSDVPLPPSAVVSVAGSCGARGDDSFGTDYSDFDDVSMPYSDSLALDYYDSQDKRKPLTTKRRNKKSAHQCHGSETVIDRSGFLKQVLNGVSTRIHPN